jgi:hypothetical protein
LPSQPALRTFGIELANQELPKITEAMNKELAMASEQLIADFLNALDAMVEQRRVGLFIPATPTSCRYTYYQFTSEDRVVDESHHTTTREENVGTARKRTHTTRTNREIERRQQLSVKMHDLIEAKQHRLNDSTIDPPPRVMPVIRAVPNWLVPHVSIISGTLIREAEVNLESKVVHLNEQHEQTHTEFVELEPPRIVQANKPDPAVVFRHYVLAGWVDELGERAQIAKKNHDQAKQIESAKQARHASYRNQLKQLREERFSPHGKTDEGWAEWDQRVVGLIGKAKADGLHLCDPRGCSQCKSVDPWFVASMVLVVAGAIGVVAMFGQIAKESSNTQQPIQFQKQQTEEAEKAEVEQQLNHTRMMGYQRVQFTSGSGKQYDLDARTGKPWSGR